MFLTRIGRRLRAIQSTQEEGFALGAVIALMAVSILVIALMSSSVVYAMGFSSATRAAVQSQAAAQAGVAAATAGVEAGSCAAVSGVFQSAAGQSPVYRALVYTPGGTDWVQGCPSAATTDIRIVSTGTAANPGTSGQGGADTKTIETILGPAASPTTIAATGPAVYSYSSSIFGGSGTLLSVNGSSPTVMISTGDVNCSGASTGASDLVVQNGSVNLSGSCNVSGTVWASGAATLSGGVSIGQNLIANSITLPSGTIHGNAWSASSTSLSGGSSVISGNLTSTSLTFNSGGKIGGNVWNYGQTTLDWGGSIAGNLTTKSVLNTNRSTVGSTTVVSSGPGQTPYSQPIPPTVPNWVDYTYVPSAWTGFTAITLPSGTCSITTLQNAVNSLSGGKGLVDARNCTNGVTLANNDQLQISNDIALFANKFVIGNSGGIVPSAPARVWMITPDNTPNGLPTCASGSSFSMSGNPVFKNSTQTIQDAVMIYTPCSIDVSSGVSFQGQLFAGAATIDGGARLGYVAIGLPGVDLSTGTTSQTAVTTVPRSIVSNRNFQG